MTSWKWFRGWARGRGSKHACALYQVLFPDVKMSEDITEMPENLEGELTIKLGVPQTHVRRSVANCLPLQFLLSEGLETLLAKTKAMVRNHTPSSYQEESLFLKSATHHSQNQYVRLDEENFEQTLRWTWTKMPTEDGRTPKISASHFSSIAA